MVKIHQTEQLRAMHFIVANVTVEEQEKERSKNGSRDWLRTRAHTVED